MGKKKDETQVLIDQVKKNYKKKRIGFLNYFIKHLEKADVVEDELGYSFFIGTVWLFSTDLWNEIAVSEVFYQMVEIEFDLTKEEVDVLINDVDNHFADALEKAGYFEE